MALFFVVVVALVAGASANTYVDNKLDAVVVEASDDVARSREHRQLLMLRLAQETAVTPVGTGFVPCTTTDGRKGNCTDYKTCYPFFKVFNAVDFDPSVMGSFDTCGVLQPDGKHIFGICCSSEKPVATPEEEAAASQPEPELPVESQVNENCGKRFLRDTIRIVNGQETNIHEFPFMAAMVNNGRQFCGGSLLDETHILTAAHCVSHMSKHDVQNLRVVLGDHNLKQSGETGEPPVQYAVKRVIRHKGFDSNTLHNDMAILTLDSAVRMGHTIQPICLATDPGQSFSGQTVEVAGWGATSAGSATTDSLRKVDVRVWTNDQCKSSYGNEAPGGITEGMICAATPEHRKDSCSGDSGGPLFSCGTTCTQIGIVSWGIGCARPEYPGVYTRVTASYRWINNIVSKY